MKKQAKKWWNNLKPPQQASIAKSIFPELDDLCNGNKEQISKQINKDPTHLYKLVNNIN